MQDDEVVGFRAAPEVAPEQLQDYLALADGRIEVRFRAGSYAERAAPRVLRRAVRAARDLRGFGSEPWGNPVVIWLVEPFESDGGHVVDHGTIVDGPGRQISYVVTPDEPIEDPHRALALVYGSVFPLAGRFGPLIEAYGLHLAGLSDDGDAVEEAGGDGEADPSGDLAFVAHLIAAEGDDAFRRYLASGPDREPAMAAELFGGSLPQLRERWQRERSTRSAQPVRIPAFVRQSARYLRPYRLRLVELAVHLLLGLSFTLAFPLVTRHLFDEAIPSGQMSEVVTLLGVLGAAFVVSLAADIRKAYLHAWIGGAVARDLRQQLYDRIQVLPAGWHRANDQGSVLSRLFTDVAQVQGGLTQVLTVGAFDLVAVAVSGAVMLSVNWLLGLVVLCGVPLIIVVFNVLAAGAAARSAEVEVNRSRLMSIAAENSRAGAVVRLFGLSGRESRRFRLQAERSFRSQQRLQTWMATFGLAINLVLRVMRLVALGLGAWLILEGRFTVGGLVAFLAIMGEVLNPVTSIANIGQSIQSCMGSLNRVNELLATPTEPAGGAEAPAVVERIELRDVSFGYGGDTLALDGVSCVIEAGTKVAFVGPSGSGKSSVLRLLMRLEEPLEGTIEVDGTDLSRCSAVSWRRRLGVVLQDSFLFDATIRENVAIGRPGAGDDDVLDAVTRAELGEFIADHPAGLDTVVGQDGSGLSGGQRQRVAIARALIRRPAVLVLDEATSALDPGTERQINETIDAAAGGATVVAVTHRLAGLTTYDRIFVLDRGRLVEQGSHAELLDRGGLYADLWADQAGPGANEGLTPDTIPALAELPLFADLDDAQLEEVAARMAPLTIESGRRYTSDRELLVIGRGRCLVGAGEVPMGPGDVIGLRSVMGGDDHQPTPVTAVTTVTAAVISAASLDGLERDLPGLARARAGRTGSFRPTGRLLTDRPAPLAPAGPGPDDITPRVEAVRAPHPTRPAITGTRSDDHVDDNER